MEEKQRDYGNNQGENPIPENQGRIKSILLRITNKLNKNASIKKDGSLATNGDLLIVIFLVFLFSGGLGIVMTMNLLTPPSINDSIASLSESNGKIVLKDSANPVEKIIDGAVLGAKPDKDAPAWRLNLIAPVAFKIYKEFKYKNTTVMVHDNSKSIFIAYYGMGGTAVVKKELAVLKNDVGPAIADAGYEVVIANMRVDGRYRLVYEGGYKLILPPMQFSYKLLIP